MPTCRSWKTGDVCWKWRPYKARQLLSKSIYAKNGGNGPPSADQDLSIAEPRHGHAVCTLRVHPPTSPCPALSAGAEPISQGHCRMWHHEAESLMILKASLAGKRLTPRCTGKLLEKDWSSLMTLIELVYQFLIKRQHFPLIPMSDRCFRRVVYSTESNAFSRSKKQSVGFSPSRMYLRMASWVEKIASAQEMSCLYAVCAQWGKPFSWRIGLSLLRMAVSRHFAMTDVKVMPR